LPLETGSARIAGVTNRDSSPESTQSLDQVLARALEDPTLDCLSRLFSAISDPTRIKILHALTLVDELRVCELAVITRLSVSAVSHQLRLLRDRNLVRGRREGRMVYYSLTEDQIGKLLRAGVEHVCSTGP
jgi:DNA-binding transcriptional ArsR family regulator